MNAQAQITPAELLEGIQHPDFKVKAVQHGNHPIIDVEIIPFDEHGVTVQANVSTTLVLNTPLDVLRGQIEHWFNAGKSSHNHHFNFQI